MTGRRVVDTEGGRKADLAAIHIGKAALGWSDDEYRDLLWTICQVRSAGDLDFAGRKRFLAHLRACGFENARTSRRSASKPATGAAGPVVPGALRPAQRKMFSLWQELHAAGLVHQRGMAALQAYAARQTGVDRLVWLNGRQEDLVIESLKKWLARADDTPAGPQEAA